MLTAIYNDVNLTLALSLILGLLIFFYIVKKIKPNKSNKNIEFLDYASILGSSMSILPLFLFAISALSDSVFNLYVSKNKTVLLGVALIGLLHIHTSIMKKINDLTVS
jgi:hypothetical protein